MNKIVLTAKQMEKLIVLFQAFNLEDDSFIFYQDNNRTIVEIIDFWKLTWNEEKQIWSK